MDSSIKKPLNRSNTLDVTSKFSSSSILNELGSQKLSLIKNKFQPLVLHAERKFHNDSMGNIIENLNKADNFDYLKGKETPLKEKALNHIKRSNSFIGKNIPYFLQQQNFENQNTNKKPGNRKKSLKTQSRISSSTDLFDILNDDYIKNKYRDFNSSKNIHYGSFIFNNTINKETFGNNNYFNNNLNNSGNVSYDIAAKEKAFVEKKNLKLNNIKNMVLHQEQLTLKSKPGINLGSQKIINKKLKGKKPIYERFEEIKNEKKAKLEKYKKELIRTNSAKNLNSANYSDFNLSNKNQMNFNNTNNNYNIKKNNQYEKESNPKNFEEWLVNNERWRGQKEKKFNALKKQLEERKLELEQSTNTHTPRIDQLSDFIANTKNFNEYPGLEVHDKLYNLKDYKIHKQKIIEQKTKPRFAPVINNYTPRYFCNSKKSAKAANQKLQINEVFGAKLDIGNNTFKESDGKKSQEDGFFCRSMLNDPINEDCSGAYERKFEGNGTSTNQRKTSFNFLFSLDDEKMKSFSQKKIDPKTGKRMSSDLTFFEQNKNNKLIFYHKN